jgi:subtilisin-like proprotein convertase family protein
MPLAVLRGGRLGGFRSYSWKQDLGEDPAGVWRVEVRTASDQLVGRIRLTVTP